MNEDRMGNAMADGAEYLVRQMEQCHRIVGESIERAHKDGDDADRERGLRMQEAQQFIRLAAEIGTALAKMKINENRQRITVERVEPARTEPARNDATRWRIEPTQTAQPARTRTNDGYAQAYHPEDVRKDNFAYERSVMGPDWTPEVAAEYLRKARAAESPPPVDAATEGALAQARAFQAKWGENAPDRGEGEGYDKQIDVVDADLEPAS